jgi:hypothetical protein
MEQDMFKFKHLFNKIIYCNEDKVKFEYFTN